MTEDGTRRANRLLHETSPYLQQHAYNPVDWYPWGEEALDRSKSEDRPIFLSIGYAACHWCHVMEHESFENEEIARYLNENFVNIKVDREERPDLDDIYMAAVQMMSGQGGWPMSVFLTPSLEPFFGGTYFPPDDRYGRPGFPRLIQGLLHAYQNRREELETGAGRVADAIRNLSSVEPDETIPPRSLIDAAVRSLASSFDSRHGGFGQAPKFPHTMGAQLMLRQYERTGEVALLEMVTKTLDKMAAGGIYDHLGGGFARYSTDERWLVPHFEKMLYDQALLTLAYVESFQITGNPEYSRIIEETLDYVLRDMRDAGGGFYSAEDADSEGVEGKFYVWDEEEVLGLLPGDDGRIFASAYDVENGGNFEGQTILQRVVDDEALSKQFGSPVDEIRAILSKARATLFEVRKSRIRPLRDEKILSGWNGLMISSFARAGRVLGNDRFVEAACRSAEFILREMVVNSILHRVHKDGKTRIPGYLEDYAIFGSALLDLYEATFETRWLEEAGRSADRMIDRFGDPDGGFFLTATDHDGLLVRMKSAQDSSVPSGTSVAACLLLRLGRTLGRRDLEERGEDLLRNFGKHMERAPGAFHQMLLGLDVYHGPRHEIVLARGDDTATADEFRRYLDRQFLPRAVFLESGMPRVSPLLAGKDPIEGKSVVYVCRDFACDAPALTIDAIEESLSR